LTFKLTARLAGVTDRQEMLAAAAEELHERLGYGVCAIVRVTDDGMLEAAAQFGGNGGDWTGWKVPVASGLIGRCILEDTPVLTNDVRTEPSYRVSETTAGTLSELDVPIRVDDGVWGAITVQESRTAAFDEDDVRLLVTIADQLGAALRSVSLFEALERAYLGTAEALAAALEAKDSYTASHSYSIVANAEAVGRSLGMSEAEVRGLRLGAAFHDIGKLAVPEAILNKRGPLTPEEREIIERHPAAGETILSPVEFLAPVLPLVRHGHERWDGFGYPDGLAGEEIPLGARIIFACDAWDAMTSDRPYRDAMAVEVARSEMLIASGSQFDPTVVDALMNVLGFAG
jgi:GAF domain-containing protein